MDAAAVAGPIAAELEWNNARMAAELDEYRRDVSSTLAFKSNL